MKKFILLAALLGGVSFSSMAGTTKKTVVPSHKPKIVVHVVGCGVDTYLYGATQAEINEGIQAIKLEYCWG